MTQPPLFTIKDVRAIFDYSPELGTFRWKVSNSNRVKVGQIAGATHISGCVQLRLFGKLYKAHRIAWFIQTGYWPKNEIDHINGNSTDNRISNLREASHAENGRNMKRPAHNTSGFKGVSWSKRAEKWRAYIKVDQRFIDLGLFTDRSAAFLAYCQAAKRYHGEFASNGIR